jgi:hypothetical protein
LFQRTTNLGFIAKPASSVFPSSIKNLELKPDMECSSKFKFEKLFFCETWAIPFAAVTANTEDPVVDLNDWSSLPIIAA